MKKVRFDCNGRHSHAYSCSEPGDNSGWYVQADSIDPPIIQLLRRTLEAHKQSTVDWDAMREIEEFLSAHDSE